MTDPFSQMEEEYFRLRGKLSTGRISQSEFEAAVKELTLQDAQGRSWMLNAEDGKWLVRDQHTWVEATPLKATAANKPTTLPEQFHSPKPSVAPVRRVNWKWGLACSTIAVCAILVLALGIVASQGIPSIGLAPVARLAPTPGLSGPVTTPGPMVVLSNIPGVRASVIAIAPPPSIDAKDYASLNASLAGKIAAMNQAQLKFIRDMRATAYHRRIPGLAAPPWQKGSALTDQDLKDLAGKAMDVAILADQLGEMSGKQGNGSASAAQSADAFYAMARNAFSLALDTQNIRQALQSGVIPGGQAIDAIASYGLQLWNNAVTDGNTKGNPFSAQTKNGGEPAGFLNPNAASQVQAQANSGNASIWIAQSSTRSTRTLNVPAAQSPVSDPFDQQIMNALTTAEGENDGNRAQQVAAANLERLGATANSSDSSKPSKLQVPTNSVAVAGVEQIKSGDLPTFKSGTATVISKNAPTDGNAFMNTFGLNGDQPPTGQGKTMVQDAPELVHLSLTNIVIDSVNKRAPGSGSFEADVNFSFTVNWNTTLASPQFNLTCNSGISQAVTQASGALNIGSNGLLILYPGTLTVYCYANSSNGQALGSTSVNVLIGDAAAATQRAIQVETDSAHLYATLTAEAVSTSSAQGTQAAATAQVLATSNAVATEVYGTQTAEFRVTASAAETQRAIAPPASATPLPTPTFAPKVVDNVFHRGDVFGTNTKVVLQRGRLYRFTFSGLVNLIDPTRSVTANQLPEHVNGIAVPASGIVVIQGNGSTAAITCSSGTADPKDPGGYEVVVEDLGPD